MGEIIDITKFEGLINGSKLSGLYKRLVIQDITYLINAKKGVGFNFVNNEDFLKVVEVILRSSYCSINNPGLCLKITGVTKFAGLINGSKLSGLYKQLIMQDMTYLINANKDVGFDFINNGNFLKAVEVILRSSIKDDSKYCSISNLRLCLKDVASNPQNKLNIVLYAMLINHGVIHTYLTGDMIYRPYIKRPNDKESDMSSYLLDDQVIKEDISWLKSKDQKKFKELCSDINKMQDKETKEAFENYLDQINSKERRNALKYTAGALAAICVVTGIIAIAGKSAVIGVVSAIAGVMFSVCLLCSNKLECVNVTRESKECATRIFC